MLMWAIATSLTFFSNTESDLLKILDMELGISRLIVLIVTTANLVNAHKNLAVRDDGDSVWSIPGKDGIGDFLYGLYEFGRDSLTKPIKLNPPNPQLNEPPPDSQTNKPPPIYKLNVASDKEKCEPDSESSDQCPAGVYLIYPLSCASVQNSEVPDQLTNWKVMYKTSLDRACGGTFFWLAYGLSLDQVDSLKKMENVVQDVVRDQYGKSEGLVSPRDTATDSPAIWKASSNFLAPNESSDLESFISARKIRRLLNRRDNDLSVSIQSDAPKQLAYISRSDTEFLYFTNAGRDITLYILDRGFEAKADDLTANAVIKYFLHSINSDGVDSDADGHGTCTLSLAAGQKFGSVKQLRAVAVKLGVSGISAEGSRYIAISDFLDGLQSISDDLNRRTMNGEKVKGYTVISISLNFAHRYYEPNVIKAKILLERLITEYQVVVVVCAGNYLPQFPLEREIHAYPALFAPQMPLIVAGGIDITTGKLHSRSLPGPQVTLLAPYQSTCAGPHPGASVWAIEGTSGSTPIIAGVLAGMLSGEWGDENRGRMNEPGFKMAVAARKYIRSKGRRIKTSSNFRIVSNGLDATKGPPLYGWTP